MAAPTLSSIAVKSGSLPMPVGNLQQFIALGTYSNHSVKDLTKSVTWTSSATKVVTISSGGIAKGVSAGSATITATLGSVSGSLNVTAAQNSVVLHSWGNSLLTTKSLHESVYQVRARYVGTKDPLPVMSHVQIVKALPSKYNPPPVSPPGHGGHQSLFELPEEEEFFEEQAPYEEQALYEEEQVSHEEQAPYEEQAYEEQTSYEEQPYEEQAQYEEQTPLVAEVPPTEEISPVEEAHQVEKASSAKKKKKKKSEQKISLNSATGYIGDEITVTASQDLPEIVEVQISDFAADFIQESPTSLIFAIPMGAPSGTVKLVSADRAVIDAGHLEVIND